MRELDDLKAGLRCQDIHGGLQNIDASTSGPIVQHLEDTRLVGMAATLAVNIRGQDVITDPEALKVIASDQLKIDSFAFSEVLRVLEDLGFVRLDQIGPRIQQIYETVPLHHSVFDDLGEVWRDRGPTQVEEELVTLVDALADGPLQESDIERKVGIEREDAEIVFQIGEQSDLVKRLTDPSGDALVYSPIFSFENPAALAEILQEHDSDAVRDAFEQVKAHQGLPLEGDSTILDELVGRGLLPAPAVKLPDNSERPFVCSTAGISHDVLTVKKAVLDKALAAVACVRCGEHYGGATSLSSPVLVLRALLDPSRDYQVRPHSSHRRQYMLLHRMQVVRYIPSGAWVGVQLIDTEDNKEAVKLAIDLLEFGEPLAERGIDEDARQLLTTQGVYLSPMQTIRTRRRHISLPDETWLELAEAARGGVPIE